MAKQFRTSLSITFTLRGINIKDNSKTLALEQSLDIVGLLLRHC